MATTTMRRVLLSGGIVLFLLLLFTRLPGRTAPAASQAAGLEERVQQLEQRLASAEARLAALEAVVPAPRPATAMELETYRTEFTAIIDAYAAFQQQIGTARDTGASAAELQALADRGTTLYRSLAQRIRVLVPPGCYTAAHASLAQAANLLDAAATFGVGTFTVTTTESLLATAMTQAQQSFASARC